MKRNDLGITPNYVRWTLEAFECYKRGCNCEGCYYKEFFKDTNQKCQMKASVLELIRILGIPQPGDIDKLIH